jgi:hypothetical protein
MAYEPQRDRWVREWAGRVDQLGLSALAIPLLDVARVIGAGGSQVLLTVQPLTRGLAGEVTVGRIAALLDRPELLDSFERCLLGDGE